MSWSWSTSRTTRSAASKKNLRRWFLCCFRLRYSMAACPSILKPTRVTTWIYASIIASLIIVFLAMHWYLAASGLQSSRPMYRAILTRSCRSECKTLRVTFLFLLDSVPHCGEDLLGRISLSCKRRFLLCLLELAVYFAFEL